MGRRRHHHDHDHDAPVAESPVIETPPVVVEPEPVVDIPPVPAILKFGVIVGQEQNYVKTATSNVVQSIPESVPTAMIEQLLFKEIGGVELINISRHDIIDGVPVNYSLIADLTDINYLFNSNNIISGFEDRYTYFNQKQIDIGDYITNVYFNEDGDIVIEFEDIEQDQNIEVMMLADGILYST